MKSSQVFDTGFKLMRGEEIEWEPLVPEGHVDFSLVGGHLNSFVNVWVRKCSNEAGFQLLDPRDLPRSQEDLQRHFVSMCAGGLRRFTSISQEHEIRDREDPILRMHWSLDPRPNCPACRLLFAADSHHVWWTNSDAVRLPSLEMGGHLARLIRHLLGAENLSADRHVEAVIYLNPEITTREVPQVCVGQRH